jgi:aspartokinase
MASSATDPASAPFRRELARPEDNESTGETLFERPRGVDKVELQHGYTTIHAGPLPEPVAASRLELLRSVAAQGVSIDFLKIDGASLSFVLPEAARASCEAALAQFPYRATPGRCVVLVHAPNMRDEEGLIARILSRVIATGARIDHVGDMHDRVLVVVSEEDGNAIVDALSAMVGKA